MLLYKRLSITLILGLYKQCYECGSLEVFHKSNGQKNVAEIAKYKYILLSNIYNNNVISRILAEIEIKEHSQNRTFCVCFWATSNLCS